MGREEKEQGGAGRGKEGRGMGRKRGRGRAGRGRREPEPALEARISGLGLVRGAGAGAGAGSGRVGPSLLGWLSCGRQVGVDPEARGHPRRTPEITVRLFPEPCPAALTALHTFSCLTQLLQRRLGEWAEKARLAGPAA